MKEGAIRNMKIGAPPLITLNLQSILAGTVVTISKNSYLTQAEVGRLSLEERPKLQFRVAKVLIQGRSKNRNFNFKKK
ncbi:uncharacterized protein DS421_18g608230 [Arachis hypogaea]|nr:uncharacterized protein DS421_18g608230 [Arachis hypogaea]